MGRLSVTMGFLLLPYIVVEKHGDSPLAFLPLPVGFMVYILGGLFDELRQYDMGRVAHSPVISSSGLLEHSLSIKPRAAREDTQPPCWTGRSISRAQPSSRPHSGARHMGEAFQDP